MTLQMGKGEKWLTKGTMTARLAIIQYQTFQQNWSLDVSWWYYILAKLFLPIKDIITNSLKPDGA